ncbi:hypothetical protein [Hypericibacter terrae]|jgi:hypothetical protein|nr:hypothetical protein [Hypericibacter terrae]
MKRIAAFLLTLALFAAVLPGCTSEREYYASPSHGIRGDLSD